MQEIMSDNSVIVSTIHDAVDLSSRSGQHRDPRILQAERHNLSNLLDQPAYVDCLLGNTGHIALVDINDFMIPERRGGVLGRILRGIKGLVWKSLKFYTFRLWAQQNNTNVLLGASLELVHSMHREQLVRLEQRLSRIESVLDEMGRGR